MKSIKQTLSYFSDTTLKAQEVAATSANSFEQTPYLKAILTEKRVEGPARVLSMANSSLAAALRYISNSRSIA